MSAPAIKAKIRRYEFQCDLVYAILALTPRFWNPGKVGSFFKKWPLEQSFWSQLDKHLYHGVYVLFYLIDKHHLTQELMPDDIRARSSQLKRELEIHHFFLANETASIIRTFHANQIPSLLLKGMSYFFCFPESYFQARLSSDIDLLIHENDLAGAEKVLSTMQYAAAEGIDPSYPDKDTLIAGYYEKTFSKTAGELRSELGLHWSIPIGRMRRQENFPVFEKAGRQILDHFWQYKKTVHWQNQPIAVLSEEDMFRHFFWNVARDHMGQINSVRWLHAAVDLYELEKTTSEKGMSTLLASEISPSKQADALIRFSKKLFEPGDRDHITSIPFFFYRALAPWTTQKKYAREVWGALWLSQQFPRLFRFACFCRMIWQNIFERGKRAAA